MPQMFECRGSRQKRFRWRRFGFEYGHWIYLTVPQAGIGWQQWEWEE